MSTDDMIVLALCYAEICGNLYHSCTGIQQSHWIERPPLFSREGKF